MKDKSHFWWNKFLNGDDDRYISAANVPAELVRINMAVKRIELSKSFKVALAKHENLLEGTSIYVSKKLEAA